MKQLALCCVHHWKIAPFQGLNAPMASNKTTMGASSASVSTVSFTFGLKSQGIDFSVINI